MLIPETVQPGIVSRFFDDFYELNTAKFASTDDGATGTNALADDTAGVMNVLTAASDNDYHFMGSTKKIVKFLASKPFRAEARVKLTEANTSAANILFGVLDTLSGIMGDNGAGPPANYTGATIFKVDGGTVWQAETSVTTVQDTNATLGTFNSGAWHTLGIDFDPGDGTTGIVKFHLDGQWTFGRRHYVTLASAPFMYLVFGVKAGSASAETISVDYVALDVYR